MGILNTTPDSFSDGGAYLDADAALQQAMTMVAAGAD
ncbi:MAG: dihydropteroate synthase, partial [Pseudomonadota bacterium]